MYFVLKTILVFFLVSLIQNVNTQNIFPRNNLRSSRQFSQNQNNRQSIPPTQKNLFSQTNGLAVQKQQNKNIGNEFQQQRPVVSNTNTFIPSSTETTTTTTAASLAYVACIKACPATSEYNPICGTNNQTFNNLSSFRCARKCGLQVNVLFNGRC